MKNRNSFLKLLSLIALLMLSLTLVVTSTFSWYPRTTSNSQPVNSFRYALSGYVTGGGNKNIETFVGTNENGHVHYSDTALDVDRVIPLNSEKVYYFKTVITETGNGGDSVVSLYVDLIRAGANFSVGLTSPEKTYESVTVNGGVVADYCIEDYVLVRNLDSTEIYWFIRYDGTTPLEIGKLFYCTNN